eukprot:scaffold304997_cov19-Tisochrysis_lutea.AAC.1
MQPLQALLSAPEVYRMKWSVPPLPVHTPSYGATPNFFSCSNKKLGQGNALQCWIPLSVCMDEATRLRTCLPKHAYNLASAEHLSCLSAPHPGMANSLYLLLEKRLLWHAVGAVAAEGCATVRRRQRSWPQWAPNWA